MVCIFEVRVFEFHAHRHHVIFVVFLLQVLIYIHLFWRLLIWLTVFCICVTQTIIAYLISLFSIVKIILTVLTFTFWSAFIVVCETMAVLFETMRFLTWASNSHNFICFSRLYCFRLLILQSFWIFLFVRDYFWIFIITLTN